MERLVFKNKAPRHHMYEISYDLIISGDRYPRTIQVPGLDGDDALARWERQRQKTNDFAECEVKGDPTLIR